MTNYTSSASESTKDGHDKSGKNLHRLTNKLSHAAENTLNAAENKLHEIDIAIKSAQTQAKEYGKTIEEYTQENPLKAVGFAALAGVVLAMLFRR